MGEITVKDLGKAYKKYPNEWARLAEWVLPGHRQRHELIWVLKNISFTVSPGEAVGIAGMNGAGKSTLLKLITGTAMPTTGSVEMTGRVAALLELGMGFDDNFTGRQNAYMSAQLLGYSVEEIDAMMPDIESFAEIGDYMDRPVRMYSSGMQMRLAFSVATAQRPDVLIVDEALSVGDPYFQHKSFERIRGFREQGTTLLLVSHDKGAIQAICDRAILLNRGMLEMEGSPEAVMDFYNAMLAEKDNYKLEQKTHKSGKTQTVSGTGEAEVREINLLNDKGESLEVVDVGQKVNLRIVVQINHYLPKLILGYAVKDRLGQVVYGTNTFHTNQVITEAQPGDDYIIDIKFRADLGPGTYSIQTALVSSDTHLENNYEWRDLALVFSVVNFSRTDFSGIAWIEPKIEINSI